MKKYFFISFLVLTSLLNAQFDISGGMGLNFFSAPDLADYINSYSTAVDEVFTFNTSADFFGEIAYNVNPNYQLALEYTYNIYSFNSPSAIGVNYDFHLGQHKPSAIGYYVIPGKGYKVKFGVGLGIRFANIEEKIASIQEPYSFSATGFGGLLKIQGDTRLSTNFFAVIAGEMRYDAYEDISRKSNTRTINYNINSFGVAIKLGIAYYL